MCVCGCVCASKKKKKKSFLFVTALSLIQRDGARGMWAGSAPPPPARGGRGGFSFVSDCVSQLRPKAARGRSFIFFLFFSFAAYCNIIPPPPPPGHSLYRKTPFTRTGKDGRASCLLSSGLAARPQPFCPFCLVLSYV